MSPPVRRWLFHGAGVLVLASALGASLLLASSRHAAEAQEAAARREEIGAGPLVQVAAVTKAPPVRTLTLTGEVHPYRQATLYAKVSGYLKMIRVDKGERVTAGEVLGVIEAPEVEQQVVSKQADLAIKKLTDARFKMLADNGLVSAADKEKSLADVQIATADLAGLNALRGYEVIRAPFTGVITARRADPGALLQAATSSQSAQALVDVADIARVRVHVFLGQSEALFVRENDPVTLWTEQQPDRKVTATITRFTRELDPRTRTMLTEIEVDNKDAPFYPGTFVKVSLSLAAPPGLSVPADALVSRAGKNYLVRAVDGRAAFAPVEIGETDGVSVRILSGIAESDKVVLHPGDDVVDGAPVRVAPAGAVK